LTYGPSLDGGLGGVGGVLAEPLLEVTDARLQRSDALLVVLQDCHQGRLGARRDLVPQVSGDRRLSPHLFILPNRSSVPKST
jgi:hypothetical protein